MSAAAVFNQALRCVRKLEMQPDAERDFVAALEAARPGPAGVFHDLAYEAGLPRDELMLRCAGLYCLFSAGNLADDLIDGDCDYLSHPMGIGPSVQFGLQHLGYSAICASGVSCEHVSEAARDLAVAGGAEHCERSLESWSLERFLEVARGIAGLQWSAYLGVVWSGTGRSDAGELGAALGLVLHLVEDIRTGDARYQTLSAVDRAHLRRWGATLTGTLAGSRSPCLSRLATESLAILETEEGG